MSYSVCIAAGTRPEIIKLAPIARALRWRGDDSVVWLATGQHVHLARQALREFALKPDRELTLSRNSKRIFTSHKMSPDKDTIGGVLAELISSINGELHRRHYDLMIVQGDTTSTLAAALAAFSNRVPVAHVEAGLRSFDLQRPFPEEAWRSVVGQIASLHFAPTQRAANNLAAAGIAAERIFVTGNTVIDSLHWILEKPASTRVTRIASPDRRLVLVTVHRRENWQGPIEDICKAVLMLRNGIPDIEIRFITHANPELRGAVERRLSRQERIKVLGPLTYSDFIQLLKRSTLILSDSGGVQEEAPTLGIPVLVLRDVTERPEVVEIGAAQLVGTNPARIVAAATRLLTDNKAYRAMAKHVNPYGDGHASERIAEIVTNFLAKRGPRRRVVRTAQGRKR